MKTNAFIVIAAAISGLANAVPHGNSHQKFHVPHVRNALKHRHHHSRHHTKLTASATSALVQTAQPTNVDWVSGTCGGTSGFVCGAGYCCSQYGYCGQGDGYCGANGSSNQTASSIIATPAGTAALSTGIPVASSAVSPVATAVSSTFATVATSVTGASIISTAQASSPTSTLSASSTTTVAVPSTSSAAGGGSGGTGFGDVFKMYNGDGSTAAGWPSNDNWESFDAMWAANQGNMGQSCAQFGVTNNSDDETADIKSAIQSVGSSAGVDPRFILAIVLQESAGCVRAPTTNYGVTNPGLMQSHDGAGSCNNGGNVQTPCPASEITQMITDGVEGTSSGDGLKQCLAAAPNSTGAQQYYEAARIYNSGSIAAGGNLDAGIATQCYSVDIANRLTGWVDAPTTCDLSS